MLYIRNHKTSEASVELIARCQSKVLHLDVIYLPSAGRKRFRHELPWFGESKRTPSGYRVTEFQHKQRRRGGELAPGHLLRELGRPFLLEANDEEPVEKALMASSSVAVTSKDSANSNLATLRAPAESLSGEVREPLSGGASTPLSGGAPTPSGVRVNDDEPVEKALMASSSVAITSEDSANSNLAILMAPAESLSGEVREHLPGGASTPLSGGAPTPSGVRASPETARPSPAPVPATARTGAAIRNNRIHRPSVVTRRAVAELTGAVSRYKGVRPNKNNNDDDDNINNNHAALAKCFQPSTVHKLRQPALYINTDTPDGNDIINNNHAALAERFQPSTLHKVRQLGRYTNTDTPDTAHQLDAEAVPTEGRPHHDQHAAELFRRGRIGPCP